MPEHGGQSISVPRGVRPWEDAVERLGRLTISRLREPTREAAEEGYPVSEVSARYWEDGEGASGERRGCPCDLPTVGTGTARPGEVFRQPDLAHTLAAVTENGADAFYEGEVARSIARSTREAGGYLDEEDLGLHESAWVEPIHTDYRGIRVYEIPPPGQGIVALEMLNILEGFVLGALDALSAGRIHLEAEAKKLAFRDLYEKVGDPEFGEIPAEELISKEHAAVLRDRISAVRAPASVEPVLSDDTIYACAMDAEGNGCSFINSLFMRFGSGVVVEGTGVCLQNRGYSFRLAEGHPNALAPGKRPLHTIIPGLATKNGSLWAIFGVMGGWMQPQGHAQLLSNLIDHGMSPQEAVDHSRHRHEGDTLLVEGRVPEVEVEKLREMGHDVEVGADYAVPTGGAQIIRVLEGGVRACGSDPRKDGCALAQ